MIKVRNSGGGDAPEKEKYLLQNGHYLNGFGLSTSIVQQHPQRGYAYAYIATTGTSTSVGISSFTIDCSKYNTLTINFRNRTGTNTEVFNGSESNEQYLYLYKNGGGAQLLKRIYTGSYNEVIDVSALNTIAFSTTHKQWNYAHTEMFYNFVKLSK